MLFLKARSERGPFNLVMGQGRGLGSGISGRRVGRKEGSNPPEEDREKKPEPPLMATMHTFQQPKAKRVIARK